MTDAGNQNGNRKDDGLARRDFFRRFIVKGLDKAEDAGKQVTDRFRDAVAAAGKSAPAGQASAPAASVKGAADRAETTAIPAVRSRSLRILRPPGALPELEFAKVCSRCGDCVKACPAQAIRLETSGDETALGGGLPFIIARDQPCVVCTDLSCMNVCPTGALRKLAVAEIAMGISEVDHARCLRRAGLDSELTKDFGAPADGEIGGSLGEDCRLCVASCPIGPAALRVGERGGIEVGAACIGCGVCERACPTEPASIFVIGE